MKKIKILIADDMKIIAESIKKSVQKNKNVEVIGVANNGQEEYEMIVKLKPNLVFTDNQMPKMNGIQVIETIYNSKIKNKPKFVLVTADRDMEIYNRAYKNGAILVINKPIEERRLLDAIDEYIEVNNYEIDEKTKEEIAENTKVIKNSFIENLKNLFKIWKRGKK